MDLLPKENKELQAFMQTVKSVETQIARHAKTQDIAAVDKLIENFQMKTEDFYRENRKLNIGVVGQVKAGKSSFLNTLLFEGKEILPKAATPKTATLTKMEYSEKNIIQVEYYSEEEWSVLEDNAVVELDDEIYTTAREIVDMVKRNGIDPHPYLKKGFDKIKFETYQDLVSNLNDYVGEDGKYTAIVKAVTLYLNKEEFKGLSIVDTPGLNDPIASRTIRTKEFMEVCDVVFFLSQSGSFLDKNDWTLLSSQLPQKGVKRLVLIASKYDSAIRDVLRLKKDDDIFDEDENSTDNIPKACTIVRKKLRKRAKSKIAEFVKDLERRDSGKELINVIKQCETPIMVSSIAYNMTGKNKEEYSSEESNIYSALKMFSKNMEEDLKLLGNFDEVKKLFDEVVKEKEEILEKKAKSFVPNAKEELKNLLSGFFEKTNKRIQVLEGNDKEQLLEQKNMIEKQIGAIRADIAVVFGDLLTKIESEKVEGMKEIRNASKDYLDIKDRTGIKIVDDSYWVSDSKWYNPFSWGKRHLVPSTREEHYSYCVVADVVGNLHKYGMESSNQVEEVFSEALQIKELKRKLLNIVVNNFDMGSEKYDSSLFRIMIEEKISSIEFPVFNVDISDAINGIAGKFNGEITSASQKTELATALSKAISQIYEELCRKLDSTVKEFKNAIAAIGKEVEESLLTNVTKEFEDLISQCENKDKEIADYKKYADILETEIKKCTR